MYKHETYITKQRVLISEFHNSVSYHILICLISTTSPMATRYLTDIQYMYIQYDIYVMTFITYV